MTHAELLAMARRVNTQEGFAREENGFVGIEVDPLVWDAALCLAQHVRDNYRADDVEPVSAAAIRQEPGWTQGVDANCFDLRLPGLRSLRVWPNTGCLELVQTETITPRVTSIRILSAGTTLGDIRKLAAVLYREGRA